MMLEKAFLPAVFMITLGFVSILKGAEYPFRNVAFLPVIIGIIGFYRIIYVGFGMTERLAILKEVARKNQDHTKLIAAYSDFKSPAIQFYHWATSMDVLILSTCECKNPVTLFLTESKESFVADMHDNQLFLCVDYWPYWKTSQLNGDYFRLADCPYQYYSP